MRKKYRTQLADIERRLNNIDTNAFAAFQEVSAEVKAVQETLGPTPQSSSLNVASRLDMMMQLIYTHAGFLDTLHARRRFPWRFQSPIARR